MTSTRVPWWVWASLLMSAGFSLWSLSFRYRVEQRNKAVTICAEMDQIELLAASQGKNLSEGLEALQSAGLTGVVIPERTIGELADQGLLTLTTSVPGDDETPQPPLATATVTLASHRFDVLFWALRGVELRFPGALPPTNGVDQKANAITVANVPIAALRATSAGLNRAYLDACRHRGLMIVGRLANSVGLSEFAVRTMIADARAAGCDAFLPVGDQVLGRRDNVGALVDTMRASKMLYATPEFAKLGGDASVVRQAPEIVLRLHAAQAAELDRMPMSDAVERYARAASERNQRVLLLRPLSPSSPRPLDAFARFVFAVRSQVLAEGLAIGRAHPFEDPLPPPWLFAAIGLAASPALFFAACAFLPWTALQIVAGVVALGLGFGANLASARPWTALACAAAFPIVGFLLVLANPRRPVWAQYAVATLASLAGGLCVAGLLNGLPYLVRAEQFMGVKAAHFLPVALIGALVLSRMTDLRRSLSSPVTWLQGALGFALLAAVGLMFLRTGNDNPAAVSDLELRLRSVLEQVLLVRPRTKEFLLGHPAMIAGLFLAARCAAFHASGRAAPMAGWTALALTLGAIGQTSVVNTLCHLHTPLDVGLIRIGVGWVLGGILGALLWVAIRRFVPKAEG